MFSTTASTSTTRSEKPSLLPLDPSRGERTLVIIKPHAFENRALITKRIEDAELSVVHHYSLRLSKEVAGELYQEHQHKKWYGELLEMMLEGDIQVVVVEGVNAVSRIRALLGTPSQPGTIRGDFSKAGDANRNAAHGSATLNDAKREIGIFYITK